ncbi:MAG: hypothetical protein FWD22_01385 [Treponema sp.]|nr:hypothetical protein [Treponema sp.]
MMNLNLTWESTESEGSGIYNEAYLADIRKQLLAAEKDGIQVSINFINTAPAWTKNKQLDEETLKDHYSAALKHAQRRLKNCKAITVWTAN